jgi:hypothetical protein
MKQKLLLTMIIGLLVMYGCMQPEYKYQYLLPSGWVEAEAEDINNSGVVVGYGSDGTKAMSFIYDNGEYTEILRSGWEFAYALALNTTATL